MRGLRLALLAAACLAAPAFASSIGVGVGIGIGGSGSGAGAPAIGNLSGSLTAGDPAGTAVLTPTISGLSGCSWTIAPTTYFTQSSSTGAIVASSTPTTAGTYTPTTTCAATSGGQAITVAASLSIVANAGAGAANGQLDFSFATQSGLLTAL